MVRPRMPHGHRAGSPLFASQTEALQCYSRLSRFGEKGLVRSMNPVEVVKLTLLMAQTRGRPDLMVGLIDGPVAMSHPDLVETHLREVPGRLAGTCASAGSAACRHGTFVAGILGARRQAPAPAIWPSSRKRQKIDGKAPGRGRRPLRARFFLHVQRATVPTVCSLVFDGCALGRVRPIRDDMGKR
jgi:hypothetical protein